MSSAPSHNSSSSRPIIFFDGVCGLCNGFVNFVLKHDLSQEYLFSPLQSEFAKMTFAAHDMSLNPDQLDTIYLLKNKTLSQKSTAVLNIFQSLGFPWRVIHFFSFLPIRWRDQWYDLMSHRRYRLFGKKPTCRLPTPEERERFKLDP